jgi:hypothetical protein
VLDLGCGDGRLLSGLLKDGQFEEIVGVDASVAVLERAARRLSLEEMAPRQRQRIRLLQGALTYGDRRLAGYDAAVLMEVIEHVDEDRLAALEHAVFGQAAPATVIVTTPNAEYNARYPGLAPGARRHPDHRFEWAEPSSAWARRRGPATAAFTPVGPAPQAADAAGTAGTAPMTTIKSGAVLVVLVGVTGSGIDLCAGISGRPVLSSDVFRGLVGDDENDQSVTAEAFEALHVVPPSGGIRRLTVIDATNVQPEARRPLVALAPRASAVPVAIVLDIGERPASSGTQPVPTHLPGPR